MSKNTPTNQDKKITVSADTWQWLQDNDLINTQVVDSCGCTTVQYTIDWEKLSVNTKLCEQLLAELGDACGATCLAELQVLFGNGDPATTVTHSSKDGSVTFITTVDPDTGAVNYDWSVDLSNVDTNNIVTLADDGLSFNVTSPITGITTNYPFPPAGSTETEGLFVDGTVNPVIDLDAGTITYQTIFDVSGQAGPPLVQDISALIAALTSPDNVHSSMGKVTADDDLAGTGVLDVCGDALVSGSNYITHTSGDGVISYIPMSTGGNPLQCVDMDDPDNQPDINISDIAFDPTTNTFFGYCDGEWRSQGGEDAGVYVVGDTWDDNGVTVTITTDPATWPRVPAGFTHLIVVNTDNEIIGEVKFDIITGLSTPYTLACCENESMGEGCVVAGASYCVLMDKPIGSYRGGAPYNNRNIADGTPVEMPIQTVTFTNPNDAPHPVFFTFINSASFKREWLFKGFYGARASGATQEVVFAPIDSKGLYVGTPPRQLTGDPLRGVFSGNANPERLFINLAHTPVDVQRSNHDVSPFVIDPADLDMGQSILANSTNYMNVEGDTGLNMLMLEANETVTFGVMDWQRVTRTLLANNAGTMTHDDLMRGDTETWYEHNVARDNSGDPFDRRERYWWRVHNQSGVYIEPINVLSGQKPVEIEKGTITVEEGRLLAGVDVV